MTRVSHIHDIEHRRPHVWLTSAINHLSRDRDAATREAIAMLSACKAQVPQPIDIGAMLRGQS